MVPRLAEEFVHAVRIVCRQPRLCDLAVSEVADERVVCVQRLVAPPVVGFLELHSMLVVREVCVGLEAVLGRTLHESPEYTGQKPVRFG